MNKTFFKIIKNRWWILYNEKFSIYSYKWKDLFWKWMDIRLKNVDDMYKLHNLLNEFIETYMSSYWYGNTEGFQEKK